MFRFSFFRSRTRSQKSKKTAPLPTEGMQKTLEDYNTNKPNKDLVCSKEVHEGNNAGSSPSSTGQDRKTRGFKSTNDTDSEHGHRIRVMRKCASLGGELVSYHDTTSGESSSSSLGNHSRDEYWKGQASVSAQISSNMVNHASDSSLDHLQGCDEEISDRSETRLSGACTGGSGSRTPCTPRHFVKSNSSPYLQLTQASVYSLEQEAENDSASHAEKFDDDSDGDDGEAYDFAGLAKDWIVPAVGELRKDKNVHEENSYCQLEELHHEDFKIKRMEKWVMDLQHSSSLEETNMLMDLDHHGQNGKITISNSMEASKSDTKPIPGMDAAKRYISSLNAAATTAQLANHGLVVIPFLSAFSSLRALNLSGNSIVRITVGAFPRGLHVLNLSKNNIATIEGLRELTRLRVLDLSYNRILRIGHGLASCSSLKELYLAGNRIGEVEGLHRLLKLSVLDLRFNKLSTTKNLGQLAANYNSLQAISLEGNPAQKNIGDEQLKKFLLGLLPNVAYFNRQSLKSGAAKDLADRAARIGISAHQADRGLWSESKKSKRGRKSQGVGGRGRRVRLPPSGVRSKGHRQRFPDRASSRPDLAMRRAHSEGMLRMV